MIAPLYNPHLSRELAAGPDAIAAYGEVQKYLEAPEFGRSIALGAMTIGMIRPSLEGSLLDGEADDARAADRIETAIANLGVSLKFSVVMDAESVDAFYDGPPKYDSMMPKPPMIDPSYGNRWEEFVALMTGGPATVLALHDPAGEAIQKWRAQLGHWNIEERRDPATLRGRFGVNNHNNLLHGSDSSESALRETAIIRDLVRRKAG